MITVKVFSSKTQNQFGLYNVAIRFTFNLNKIVQNMCARNVFYCSLLFFLNSLNFLHRINKQNYRLTMQVYVYFYFFLLNCNYILNKAMDRWSIWNAIGIKQKIYRFLDNDRLVRRNRVYWNTFLNAFL